MRRNATQAKHAPCLLAHNKHGHASCLQPPGSLGGLAIRAVGQGVPVDIAALARVHGPRCIAVAVELLDDPDSRVRLGALTALLDRGFGRPAQVIATPDGNSPIAMHLLAATMISEQLTATLEQRERYAISMGPPSRVTEGPPSICPRRRPRSE